MAGTFGSGEIDRTFGPDVRFVEARSQVLTVSLHGVEGQKLYSVDVPPEA